MDHPIRVCFTEHTHVKEISGCQFQRKCDRWSSSQFPSPPLFKCSSFFPFLNQICKRAAESGSFAAIMLYMVVCILSDMLTLHGPRHQSEWPNNSYVKHEYIGGDRKERMGHLASYNIHVNMNSSKMTP